jgi:hypothetical protein
MKLKVQALPWGVGLAFYARFNKTLQEVAWGAPVMKQSALYLHDVSRQRVGPTGAYL